MTKRKDEVWRYKTYDTFEDRFYGGGIKYPSEEAVQEAAREVLLKREKSQPSSSSGGQGFGGIQDQVFIVRPDGTMYRFTG